jgi:hypothetical protein
MREIISRGLGVDDRVMYDFVCEGCGAEGRLGVPIDQHKKPFGCPEDCGATYIQWKHEGQFRLTCVVCPIFENTDV